MKPKCYLLNRHNTRLWFTKLSWLPWAKPEYRPDIVKQILLASPHGAAVAMSTLRVVAMVDARGRITDLEPPYKVAKIHEVINRPSVVDCQCLNWSTHDNTPWADMPAAKKGAHHPLCQFNPLALDNVRNTAIWIPRSP